MNLNLRITAFKLNDNREITLSNVKDMNISATLDSPAMSMSATFAPDEAVTGLGVVNVYENSKLLFSGKVDNQKSTISRSGVGLIIDARSKAAALLDNQAQPCVLFAAQLTTVFNQCIQPYGFVIDNPYKSTYLPMYTIRAGASEWDALIDFTRRAYGVTPYIIDSQIMMRRPPSGNSPLIISNIGNGISYTSLAHSLTPYNIISQVFLRDENGFYSSVVNNSSATLTKSVRKRYLTPPTEYVDVPALSANQKIRRSMFMSEELVATLPGIVDAPLGRDVQVVDKFIKRYNLMVVKREHIVSGDGVLTRLTLRSSIYYD